MYEFIFVAAVGTGIVVAMLTLRRPADTMKDGKEQDVLKPVYIEELSSPQATSTSSAEAVLKEGLSNEDFKELFLNPDKSIREIATACGYKSRSSVYHRAKRLGLSIKTRRK